MGDLPSPLKYRSLWIGHFPVFVCSYRAALLAGTCCAGGVVWAGMGFLSPPLLVELGNGTVFWGALCKCGLLLLARLMQYLPSRLTAQVRAAVAGRSTPVLSSTSSSRHTPPPPRTGETVSPREGCQRSRGQYGKEGVPGHLIRTTGCRGLITS